MNKPMASALILTTVILSSVAAHANSGDAQRIRAAHTVSVATERVTRTGENVKRTQKLFTASLATRSSEQVRTASAAMDAANADHRATLAKYCTSKSLARALGVLDGTNSRDLGAASRYVTYISMQSPRDAL